MKSEDDLTFSSEVAETLGIECSVILSLYKKNGVSKNKIMYATGFCGSGVVWAWWVGRKAAMKLLNHDEAATAFDGSPPMALPFYSGKPWFLPAVLLWHKLNDKFGATSKK